MPELRLVSGGMDDDPDIGYFVVEENTLVGQFFPRYDTAHTRGLEIATKSHRVATIWKAKAVTDCLPQKAQSFARGKEE